MEREEMPMAMGFIQVQRVEPKFFLLNLIRNKI